MAEAKKYSGSCHCGNVRFEVTTDMNRVVACNCSICSRAGYLLTFVGEDQFTLLAGADAQTDYQFNRHRIHHLFCKTCGVRTFARGSKSDGTPTFAINVRCLDGVDPGTLNIQPFDGRNL